MPNPNKAYNHNKCIQFNNLKIQDKMSKRHSSLILKMFKTIQVSNQVNNSCQVNIRLPILDSLNLIYIIVNFLFPTNIKLIKYKIY